MTLVLVSVRQKPITEPRPRPRRFWLESWDGTRTIAFGPRSPWTLLSGSLGLEVPPVDVVTTPSPGVAGSAVADVLTPQRPVVIRIGLRAPTVTDAWEHVQELRDLTDPAGCGPDGSFRIVCESPNGVRQLGLVYTGGLEGDGQSSPNQQFAVAAVAPQPFAEDRTPGSQSFSLAAGTAFLGGTWPVQLSRTLMAATGDPVNLDSAVPVWPTFSLSGLPSGATITTNTGMRVDITQTVGSAQTLTFVTDPRRRSIRINGAPAAGMIARGSRLVPFKRGQTLLSVTAAGANTTSTFNLQWRGLHRSLW